ncbi:hypothetical protein PF003_g27727 [Phytophthora fragariae]|nr:hypothetical protein PF003_g27727 [Phytophthora fragariae]
MHVTTWRRLPRSFCKSVRVVLVWPTMLCSRRSAFSTFASGIETVCAGISQSRPSARPV